MSILLLPQSAFLTADQRWAWNTGHKLAFACTVSIVAAGASLIGFGFTSNFGLPREKHGGKVNNVAHKFFAVTLSLSGVAVAANVLGVGYCYYVFSKL